MVSSKQHTIMHYTEIGPFIHDNEYPIAVFFFSISLRFCPEKASSLPHQELSLIVSNCMERIWIRFREMLHRKLNVTYVTALNYRVRAENCSCFNAHRLRNCFLAWKTTIRK